MPNTPILAIPQLTENQSAKEVTINDAILALESAMGKGLIVDYAATTTVTLSVPQLTRNFLLKISGATAACQLVIPDAVAGVATARVFAVSNLSAWDCTVKASSTAPADQVIIPSLQTCLIAADGAAIRLIAKNVPNGAFADMTDVDWTTIGDGKTIIWDAGENKFTFVTPLTEGSGVPTGGTDGQVLQKVGGAPAWGDIPTPDVRQVPDGGEVFFVLTKTGEGDNDYDWAMLPEGVATPSFLTLSDTPTSYADQGGKVVVVKAAADGLEFIDMPVSLPAGGTVGQVLARDAEGAAVWITPAAGGGGGIADAPVDGSLYARKDGAWESFTTGSGGSSATGITKINVPIVNPGAETADVSGWTVSGIVASTNFGTGTPRSGTHFFAADPVATATMTQTISTSAYAAEIDAGRVLFEGAVFTQTTYSTSERSEYLVEFLNSVGTVIGESRDSISGIGTMVRYRWNKLKCFEWMPAGTRSIRITATSVRLDGTNNDNSFDDFTASLFIFAGASQTIVEQVSTTASDLLAAHTGHYIRFTNTAAKTLTVQPESVSPLPSNGEWHIRNAATGDLTVAAGAGVTINAPYGGTLVIPPQGTATLKRAAEDIFDLMGQTV